MAMGIAYHLSPVHFNRASKKRLTSLDMYAILQFNRSPWRLSGGLAQLGERLNGIQKVRGSNPLSSTINLRLSPSVELRVETSGRSLQTFTPAVGAKAKRRKGEKASLCLFTFLPLHPKMLKVEAEILYLYLCLCLFFFTSSPLGGFGSKRN